MVDLNNHNPDDPRSPFHYDPSSTRMFRSHEARHDDSVEIGGAVGFVFVILVGAGLAIVGGDHDLAVVVIACSILLGGAVVALIGRLRGRSR
jgi:hypothetical protein